MTKYCYVHIPFCKTICSYCDFCKLLYEPNLVDRYLDALEREIDSIYQGEALETIYIGGGTPSCLNMAQLERLFQILNKLNKSKEVEITIEGNFESTTKEKLEFFQKQGVNRLSFGMESMSEKNLEFLERSFNKEEAEKVIKEARKFGFQNINIDLMYALPKESIEDLKEDLSYLFSLEPEHISTYSLILEDHTKLALKNIQPMDEELDAKMYEEICQEMRNHSYEHYEISNFAKKGKESRHNLCYWNNEEYYGFGLGASSYIGNERKSNTKSLTQYLRKNEYREIETVGEKEKIEYEVILNLRKKEGISLEKFQEKYNRDFWKIFPCRELVNQKLLKVEENHLSIPENKWYISNEIIVQILEREKYE